MYSDLRDWLDQVDGLGQLRQVKGVDYEAVGKSTHIQHFFPISETS